MILQEFINKYNGKKVDYDHAFGAQCMDLYRFYMKEVWGLPQTPSVKGAYQVFNTLPQGFQKFINGIPQPGDVITWNEGYVENGHIAIVVSTKGSTFMSFDQNNPTNSPCRIAEHTYKNVIGWFRPERKSMPYYIERPSKIDPSKTEVGIAIDQGEQTTILWATNEAWGDQLSKHYLPQGVFKVTPK